MKEKKRTVTTTEELQTIEATASAEFASGSERIEFQFNSKYLKDKREYIEKNESKNNTSKRKRKLDELQVKATILNLILKSYDEAGRQIVGKIKSALQKYPGIANQLKGTAKMRHSKIEIPNPYEAEHLPGIIEILYDRYQKRSFVSFTNSLIEALNWRLTEQETLKDPSKGVSEVQQMYAMWERKDLWKQLTKDQFFSVVLIRGLHQGSALRREVLTEVTKYIQTLDETDDPDHRDPNAMPIFGFIGNYIQREQTNRKMITDEEASGATKPAYNNNGGKKKSVDFTQSWSKRSNVESAASAEHDSQHGEAYASTEQENKKLYSGEVTHELKVTWHDSKKNQDYTYLAVDKKSKICAKCYPDDGKPTSPCSRQPPMLSDSVPQVQLLRTQSRCL